MLSRFESEALNASIIDYDLEWGRGWIPEKQNGRKDAQENMRAHTHMCNQG